MVKKIYRTYRSLTVEEEKEKFGFSPTEDMMRGVVHMINERAFLKRIDTVVEEDENDKLD